jgi:pimeloyl-ACP methyl ester carboxylesterase
MDARELERLAFMGHSWGGSIAVHLAARLPDRLRALVLLDSGHVDYGELPDIDADRPLDAWIAEAAERPSRWASWAAFADELRPTARRWTPEVENAVRAGVESDGEAVASIAGAETRGAAMWGLAPTWQSAAWPALAAARLPISLLTATEPPESREENELWAARFAAAVPQAEIRPVANAGHSLLVDVGPPLGDEIGRWLRSAA